MIRPGYDHGDTDQAHQGIHPAPSEVSGSQETRKDEQRSSSHPTGVRLGADVLRRSTGVAFEYADPEMHAVQATARNANGNRDSSF